MRCACRAPTLTGPVDVNQGYHPDMSEENMVDHMNQALEGFGIEDTVSVVGQFQPRGTSGGHFTGGMIGSSAGGAIGGSVGDAVGLAAGMLVGGKAAANAEGLPQYMVVGVSDTMVYGMHARSRSSDPDQLVFAVKREGLRAVVHQRGMVRVLELIHDDSESKVELEGSRVPVTHAKDVMDALTS